MANIMMKQCFESVGNLRLLKCVLLITNFLSYHTKSLLITTFNLSTAIKFPIKTE